MHRSLLAAVVLPLSALAQQTLYGQCGGIGWKGATTCVAGSTCTVSNPYYSQCLPGGSGGSTSTVVAPPKSTTSTSSSKPTTMMTSTKVSSSISTPPTKTTTTSVSTTIAGPTGSGPTGAGPGNTLLPGYLWIRSVEAPNFHHYLQTNPEYTTGTAIMGDYTTAGQFNIVSGQLVELIDTKGTLLYANVAQQSSPSETTLPVAFSTTPNTYGTFAFQGDAVTWSVAGISRPNTAAWYVCTGEQLFINLGNYDYGTPATCADETIHYYNGATAVD
ncbi:hypothetical protein MMC25_001875 [Agyrium rufum]|nr:hypothetical protein [Agyrium rufum]